MLPMNDLKQRVQFFGNHDYNIKVAGVKFHQDELRALQIKDWNAIKVRLKADPTNKYDSNAVKVFFDRIHVGYLPAMVAQAFSENNINLKDYKCSLVYITDGANGKFITSKIALRKDV